MQAILMILIIHQNLNKNSKGYFNINWEKNLEVFGNGSIVKSISIAPFKLETKFILEKGDVNE